MINRIAGLAPSEQRAAAGKPDPAARLVTASDVKQIVESAEQLISKYPAAVLAASFFAGVALAWWIKRK